MGGDVEVEVLVGEPSRLFGQADADHGRPCVEGNAAAVAGTDGPFLFRIDEDDAQPVSVRRKPLQIVDPGRRDRLARERVSVVADGKSGRVEQRQSLHNHGLGAVLPPEIRAEASPIMHPFGVTVTGFIGRGGRVLPGARTTSASLTSPGALPEDKSLHGVPRKGLLGYQRPAGGTGGDYDHRNVSRPTQPRPRIGVPFRIVKRFVALFIVMILAVLPVLPMPHAFCYRIPAAATVHPCCPATSVRVPAVRATIRVAAAVQTSVPTSYGPRPTMERSAYGPAERGHYCDALSTIQLRI